MRLDKYLAGSGLSRSEARAAVSSGRAAINGCTLRDAGTQVPPGACVTLDGAVIGAKTHLHLMLHKPPGVVTAARDSRLATVFDLLPAAMRRPGLSAVGRLDRDTTGLLLFTTDGQLAHRLISPRWLITKVYRATLSDGELEPAHIARMAQGIALTDFTARPAQLTILSSNVGELTVTEGKYHQVKRMFGALGLTVTQLHRLSVGGVALDDALQPGVLRELTDQETQLLYTAVQLEEQP